MHIEDMFRMNLKGEGKCGQKSRRDVLEWRTAHKGPVTFNREEVTIQGFHCVRLQYFAFPR